jgi:hypothetical protein
MSMAEAITKPLVMNIFASFLWTFVLAPMYGFEFPLSQSFGISIGFLVTSICLGYVVRRIFNSFEEQPIG